MTLLLAKTVLVRGFGMAVAIISLRRKWHGMIVPSSLNKRELLQ
jgi:hypothetical protein